jgi:hypothetical protein
VTLLEPHLMVIESSPGGIDNQSSSKYCDFTRKSDICCITRASSSSGQHNVPKFEAALARYEEAGRTSRIYDQIFDMFIQGGNEIHTM